MAASLGTGPLDHCDDLRGSARRSSPLVAFDALPGALIAVNRDRRIVALNAEALALFACTRDDYAGRPLRQLLPDLDCPVNETAAGDCPAIGRRSEPVHLHWQARPFDTATGVQLILLRDVADESRAVRALARSEAHVERLLREFECFAYVASHDLQEPLRMIRSFTALLARRHRERLDDEGREFLRFAHDGARHLQSLLNGLLDYTRLGAERVRDEQVDLEDVFRHAVRTLALTIEDAGADIVAAPLPTVIGSRSRLRTVFHHLLANSLKFKSPDRRLRVEISALRQDAAWQLCFSDNGAGIDRDHWQKVFALFQRLPRDRRLKGAGMGLALCRKICECQGGNIAIEASSAQGTRIIVTWPDAAP
jgi:light-regulated signal transduction histidine kinase (bacteriophytochrome)